MCFDLIRSQPLASVALDELTVYPPCRRGTVLKNVTAVPCGLMTKI